MLNKYPVIPNHFILATKSYKDQRQLLEEDDLEATLSCLRTWGEEGSRGGGQRMNKLFAFFNSGKQSGASQPHRHIQFLPVEDMVDDERGGRGWRLLVEDASLQLGAYAMDGSVCSTKLSVPDDARPRLPPGFPFLYFYARLSPDHGSGDIHRIYMRLYGQAVSAIRLYNARHPADPIEIEDHGGEEGWSAISYNLAMTTTSMMLCPRRREAADLKIDDQGGSLGPISLNGTMLAGTLMVKTQDEWDALRSDESKLNDLLEAVGIPPGSIYSQAPHSEGKL